MKAAQNRSHHKANASVVLRAGKSTQKLNNLPDEVGSIVSFGHHDVRMSPGMGHDLLRSRQGPLRTPNIGGNWPYQSEQSNEFSGSLRRGKEINVEVCDDTRTS